MAALELAFPIYEDDTDPHELFGELLDEVARLLARGDTPMEWVHPWIETRSPDIKIGERDWLDWFEWDWF